MGNEIDEIMDEFDFERVHKVMVALNWKWQCGDELPSIADLRRHARTLLRVVVEGKDIHKAHTNGFTAYMHDGLLGLRFEVSSHEIEIEVEKGIGQ
jgi:hypothetical protein